MSNILFFCNYQVAQPACGGIIRVTGSLSKLFSQHGHHCFLCYYLDCEGTPDASFEDRLILLPKNEKDALSDYITSHKIDLIILQVPLNNSNWYLLPLLRGIIDEKGVKCRLIHCYHSIPFAECKGFDLQYLLYMKKQKEALVPKIKKMTWALLCILFPKVVISKTAHRYDFICKYCDNVILLSERYIPFFIKHVKCKPQQIIGINNPLTFPSNIDESEFSNKEKIVLFVGRMDESTKRLSRAIRIWSSIEHDYSIRDWSFVVVGDGPDLNYYKEYAAKCHVKNILFVGKQLPIEYYKKASIFMLSSAIEGFPMVILEAKQMGCVPFAFNSFDAVYDLITDSIDGYICKNIPEYASKLYYLMTHDDVRMEMMRRCLKNDIQFSYDTIYSHWEKLLN